MREGLEGLRAGKRQALTPLKTDGWGVWLRELPWKGLREGLERVAARVAVERPAGGFGGFGRFEGGQTAGLNALKNRWLGRVAVRVAVERLPCSCESCRGKACGRVWRVWKV